MRVTAFVKSNDSQCVQLQTISHNATHAGYWTLTVSVGIQVIGKRFVVRTHQSTAPGYEPHQSERFKIVAHDRIAKFCTGPTSFGASPASLISVNPSTALLSSSSSLSSSACSGVPYTVLRVLLPLLLLLLLLLLPVVLVAVVVAVLAAVVRMCCS
jgi:hypothetical protein